MTLDLQSRAWLQSLLLHGAVAMVLLIGAPLIKPSIELPQQTILVEVVDIDTVTNLPSMAKLNAAKNQQKPKPAATPPAAPVKKTAPPPPPEKTPTPVAKPNAKAPIAAPKKVEAPTKPTPKTAPPSVLVDKSKESDDGDFLSVIAAVEKLASGEQTDATSQTTDVPTSPGVSNAPFNPDFKLSVTQMDAVRQAIGRCWYIPSGARNAHDLLIEIEVIMNADATVQSSRIVDQSKMYDPFYRTAAESAMRAIQNPACQPWPLPLDQFNQWQRMRLVFNPRDMLQ